MKLDSGFHFNVNNTALEWRQQTPLLPTRRAITAYSDGTGKVNVAAATHGYVTGDIIIIQGTTSYNGVWTVTLIDAGNFSIPATWVADDGASECSKPVSFELARADVKVLIYTTLKIYYRFSLLDNVAGEDADRTLNIIDTDFFVNDTTEKEWVIPWGMTEHKTDKIYLLFIPAVAGAPSISAVIQ